MGIWSWDIIGCDANLELAMDLLTCAGIGPKDYATRRATFKIIMCSHPTESGGSGMWLGRHSPEEYQEFFACLDASAKQYKAIDAAFNDMVKFANSVQTVFDISGHDEDGNVDDGSTPVGHAFHVLGLLLMQAGALRTEVADMLLSIPICAASVPGEKKEREAHEERFKAAIREYKAARVEQHEAFLYTRVDAATPVEHGPPHVSVRLETFPVYRGDAIKYRPRR